MLNSNSKDVSCNEITNQNLREKYKEKDFKMQFSMDLLVSRQEEYHWSTNVIAFFYINILAYLCCLR